MNFHGIILLAALVLNGLAASAPSISDTGHPSGGISVKLGKNREMLVNGKSFFPIMMWKQRASNMEYQKSLGINVFVGQGDGSEAGDFCDQARERGVYAIPEWDSAQAPMVKNNPALLGWIFDDEPDNQSHKVPPSSIRSQYYDVREKDPTHLSFLTVTASFSRDEELPAWLKGNNAVYHEYAKYTDLIGFDIYPIYGWCRPDWIYKVGKEQCELAVTFAGPSKGTFQWIECSKTSGQWCSNASRGTDDGPSGYEVTDEVWLAIVNGATAIGYFTHSWKCPGYSQCCLSEGLIAAMKNTNRRITALTGALCAADAQVPISAQCTDPAGKIETRIKEYNGCRYLIAVNVLHVTGARDTQQVLFTVPGLAGRVRVYDENRTIDPKSGVFADRFTPKDPVHIYLMPIRR